MPSLPWGQIDAALGERGGRLNGGEEQRIFIARAFRKQSSRTLLLIESASCTTVKCSHMTRM